MNKKLTDIEKQIAALKAEQEKLLKEQRDKEYAKNWRELCSSIRKATLNDFFSIVLEPTTKTIPIFDKFTNSKSPYMLIKNYGFLRTKVGTVKRKELNWFFGSSVSKTYNSYKGADYSLILCKSWKRIDYISSDITATHLKQEWRISPENPPKYFVLRVLWEEIKKIVFTKYEAIVKNGKDITNRFLPFTKPIMIGAQTSKNREGYGNQYCGEELVYEGTKYGETTNFLIVGCFIHKTRKYESLR